MIVSKVNISSAAKMNSGSGVEEPGFRTSFTDTFLAYIVECIGGLDAVFRYAMRNRKRTCISKGEAKSCANSILSAFDT